MFLINSFVFVMWGWVDEWKQRRQKILVNELSRTKLHEVSFSSLESRQVKWEPEQLENYNKNPYKHPYKGRIYAY